MGDPIGIRGDNNTGTKEAFSRSWQGDVSLALQSYTFVIATACLMATLLDTPDQSSCPETWIEK